MDVKEFNLLFSNDSPLFRSDVLENIVKNVLLDERVPHAVSATFTEQTVTNMTHGKLRSATEERNTTISADNMLQKGFLLNGCSFERCKKKGCYSSLERGVRSEQMNSTNSNTSLHSTTATSSIDISQKSQQLSAHAPQLALARVQDTSSSKVSEYYNSHVQSRLNHAGMLDTSLCSENVTLTDDIGMEKRQIYSNESLQRNTFCNTKVNGSESTLRNGDIRAFVTEGQSCSRFLSHCDSVSNTKSCHFVSARDQEEFTCTAARCQDKEGTVSNMNSDGCSVSVSYRTDDVVANNSRGICSQTTSTAVEEPAIKYPGENNHREKDLKRVNVTFGEGVTCEKDDTTTAIPEVITPAEIGKIDKRELEEMIKSLVKANEYFTEFPRHDEPEKNTLIQEQNKYLEKAKQAACYANEADEKERIRSRVLEVSVKYIEKRITESVRFAKLIPGFLQLPLEDQANLIRESRTESGIVGGMRGINADKQVFSSQQGFFSLEDMKLVFDENLLMEKIMLSKKISALKLTLEEEAILRALTITATDRCELVRKDIVEDIQNKLQSCLLHVISERGHEPLARRLGKLFDILICCRNITEVDMKQVKKILLEWPAFSEYKLAEEFL